jgi:hypothetical protein
MNNVADGGSVLLTHGFLFAERILRQDAEGSYNNKRCCSVKAHGPYMLQSICFSPADISLNRLVAGFFQDFQLRGVTE